MGVGFFPAGLNESLVDWFAELGEDVPDHGVLLLTIERNSGADQAGLLGGNRMVNTQYGQLPVGGDVVINIDGTPITTPRDFIAYLETYTRPGDTVQVTVLRDMEELVLPVVLGEKAE
jgi:2-alkenal reductase